MNRLLALASLALVGCASSPALHPPAFMAPGHLAILEHLFEAAPDVEMVTLRDVL